MAELAWLSLPRSDKRETKKARNADRHYYGVSTLDKERLKFLRKRRDLELSALHSRSLETLREFMKRECPDVPVSITSTNQGFYIVSEQNLSLRETITFTVGRGVDLTIQRLSSTEVLFESRHFVGDESRFVYLKEYPDDWSFLRMAESSAFLLTRQQKGTFEVTNVEDTERVRRSASCRQQALQRLSERKRCGSMTSLVS